METSINVCICVRVGASIHMCNYIFKSGFRWRPHVHSQVRMRSQRAQLVVIINVANIVIMCVIVARRRTLAFTNLSSSPTHCWTCRLLFAALRTGISATLRKSAAPRNASQRLATPRNASRRACNTHVADTIRSTAGARLDGRRKARIKCNAPRTWC